MQRSPALLSHVALRLRVRPNPLRRGSDLVQAAVRAVAVVVCLAGLPLAAWLGLTLHTHLDHVAAHQAATRIAHPAADPQPPTDQAGRAPYAVRTGVDVRWTTADGRPTTAPLTRGDVTVDAVLAAMALEVAVVGLAWLFLIGSDRLLDRHRYRRWDTEWAILSTAPHR